MTAIVENLTLKKTSLSENRIPPALPVNKSYNIEDIVKPGGIRILFMVRKKIILFCIIIT